MKDYAPTARDVATDLQRCIYASLKPDGFRSATFDMFFKHALKIYGEIENDIEIARRIKIATHLKKAQNDKLNIRQRQEHLHMASYFLSGL